MMDNVLNEIENQIDNLKRILYEWNEHYESAYKKLDDLEKYVESIKELNKN